jgi:hypothetical protein
MPYQIGWNRGRIISFVPMGMKDNFLFGGNHGENRKKQLRKSGSIM